jgi:hypothetical protein
MEEQIIADAQSPGTPFPHFWSFAGPARSTVPEERHRTEVEEGSDLTGMRKSL